MRFEGVDIPEELLKASFDGTLVVFAGAGVSMQQPVGLPSFNALLDRVKEAVDLTHKVRKRRSKYDSSDNEVYIETPEQYLSLLERHKPAMRFTCAHLLDADNQTTELHRALTRVFPDDKSIRVVTTNFDTCFELAFEEGKHSVPLYSAPALPLGDDFNGLVHLHGCISEPESMVLTAQDYGRAYVSRGWAARFLVDLFKSHTVLFVGYSCGDSLVDYLTRSISSEIDGNAFVLCRQSDGIEEWEMRGIKPVLYQEHDDLPGVIRCWANYRDQSFTEKVLEVREIASIANPDDHQVECLCHALNWNDTDDRAVIAREFTAHSASFEHLRMLEEHHMLSFLTTDSPTESDRVLLNWAIKTFATGDCQRFQRVCARIRSSLSACFYDELVWYLAVSKAPASAVGPWVAWLEYMPHCYLERCLDFLADIAINADSSDIALAILRMLLRVDFKCGEPGSLSSDSQQEAVLVIKDNYHKRQLIDVLARYREAIGQELCIYCVNQIELVYSIQTSCWTNVPSFDSVSFTRASVDACEQEGYSQKAGSVLLDFACESIGEPFAESVMARCLESKCVLLIRFGLWIKSKFFCAGDALSLIAERGYLSNRFLKHEVYQLMRGAYKGATFGQRSAFAEYLREWHANDTSLDYECFSICAWLLQDQSDECLEQLRGSILAVHPNYLPREHPDLLYYTTSGFVDITQDSKLDKASFTIDNLLASLHDPKNRDELLTPWDIVSASAKDYPARALELVQELLSTERDEERNELCGLLIQAIDWGSFDAESEAAFAVLLKVVADEVLCVQGVGALEAIASQDRCSAYWSHDRLGELLLALSSNVEVLIADPLDFHSENPDWLTFGINHPAGKYIELLAKLDSVSLKETSEHSPVAMKLIENFALFTQPESNGIKGAIACWFFKLNQWVEINPACAAESTECLRRYDWARVPACRGIAYLPGFSQAAWEAIPRELWEELFRGDIDVGDECLSSLVRLYVWAAIELADKTDRVRMFEVCSLESGDSFKEALLHVGRWFETLEPSGRLRAWDEWLLVALRYLEQNVEAGVEVIAMVFSQWIERYPELRSRIAAEPVCKRLDIKANDFPRSEDVFSNIAMDVGISLSDKVTLIVFKMNRIRRIRHMEDAAKAASLIDTEGLSEQELRRLKDAYTRKGMPDAFGQEGA